LATAVRPAPIRTPAELGRAKVFMFISHDGEVRPSGFLPVCAGDIRHDSPVALHRDTPLFRAPRDPGRLCGRCEYRPACGGSRARAFALGGDPLGEDPTCMHRPEDPC
jgi:radical SAM protein with 4Fe4S-binding SPASM domain